MFSVFLCIRHSTSTLESMEKKIVVASDFDPCCSYGECVEASQELPGPNNLSGSPRELH